MADERTKLWDDIRAIPSWVWLGGAAVVGVLFVLRSQSGGSSTSATTSAGTTSSAAPLGAPIAGTAATDYSTESAIAGLQAVDNQILAQLQGYQVNTNNSTSGVTPPSSGYTAYVTNGSTPYLYLIQASGDRPQSTNYVYQNGVWSSLTSFARLQQMQSNGVTGTQVGNYTGSGTYGGVTVP